MVWEVTKEEREVKLRDLQKHAESMRQNPTEQEKILCGCLIRYKMDFEWQRPLVDGTCNFIADFYIPKAKLVVEVDGDTHNYFQDWVRDYKLRREGYEVFRVSNKEVDERPREVIDEIKECIDWIVKRLPTEEEGIRG